MWIFLWVNSRKSYGAEEMRTWPRRFEAERQWFPDLNKWRSNVTWSRRIKVNPRVHVTCVITIFSNEKMYRLTPIVGYFASWLEIGFICEQKFVYIVYTKNTSNTPTAESSYTIRIDHVLRCCCPKNKWIIQGHNKATEISHAKLTHNFGIQNIDQSYTTKLPLLHRVYAVVHVTVINRLRYANRFDKFRVSLWREISCRSIRSRISANFSVLTP